MDNVNLTFRVGPGGPDADGSAVIYPRTDRFHNLRAVLAVGEYEEMTARGEVYCACNQAAVTFGTALTLTAVTFTLSNPVGSPVDLVLLNVAVTFATGTTAGELVLAANVNNNAVAITHGTPLTVRNARLDGAAGYGLADSAATLPAAPVAIRTLGYVVSTAPVNAGILNDEVKGAVILGPNTAVTVQGITCVATGLVSMFWRERRRLSA